MSDVIDVAMVQRTEPNELRRVEAVNPMAQILESMVQKGITAENANALEKVCDMFERMEAWGAKKQFGEAFSQLQAELPQVVAERIIPDNEGRERSSFAAMEDVMRVVQPYLTKHGFSVSFTSRLETINGKDRICAICTLTHKAGHSQSNEFSVRVCPPPRASDAQADGSTFSYAKRAALCAAINVSVDHNGDARIEGAYISGEWANELRRRCAALKWDEKLFLRLAGADDFTKIRDGKLGVLQNALKMKEEQKATGKPPQTQPKPQNASTPSSSPIQTNDNDLTPEEEAALSQSVKDSEPADLFKGQPGRPRR